MKRTTGNLPVFTSTEDRVPCRLSWRVIVLVACVLVAGTVCIAQASDPPSRFSLQVETEYERTALNYHYLLADTAELTIDSLEQLQKSADTRTEPSAGLRAMLTGKGWHLNNGIYYSPSGWREQFDGRGRLGISDNLSVQSRARFDYRQENREEDSLFSDYWNAAGDIRLLAALSDNHTAFIRTDGECQRYVDQSPAVGYDYNRLRSRMGWRWQSATYDFVELTAGIGRRFVPDSTEQEYDERFASFNSDFGWGERNRIALDLYVNAKDYESADPTDDYSVATLDGRWDYRPSLSWLVTTRLRCMRRSMTQVAWSYTTCSTHRRSSPSEPNSTSTSPRRRSPSIDPTTSTRGTHAGSLR